MKHVPSLIKVIRGPAVHSLLADVQRISPGKGEIVNIITVFVVIADDFLAREDTAEEQIGFAHLKGQLAVGRIDTAGADRFHRRENSVVSRKQADGLLRRKLCAEAAHRVVKEVDQLAVFVIIRLGPSQYVLADVGTPHRQDRKCAVEHIVGIVGKIVLFVCGHRFAAGHMGFQEGAAILGEQPGVFRLLPEKRYRLRSVILIKGAEVVEFGLWDGDRCVLSADGLDLVPNGDQRRKADRLKRDDNSQQYSKQPKQHRPSSKLGEKYVHVRPSCL